MTNNNQFGPLYLANLLEKFLSIMKNLLSVKFFNFLKKWILLIAQWSFYVASVVSLLAGIIAAIRIKGAGVNIFFTALAFSLGIFVVQYVGNKFLNAGDILIEENETSLSSAAFLDSFALLSIIAGAGIFLFQIYAAIKIPSFSPLLAGIVLFVLLWFLAFVFMNPKEISVKVVKKTTAGQEAIGITSLLIKSVMKIIPLVFGIGVIFGTIYMFVKLFGLFKAIPLFAWSGINFSMFNIILAGLSPLFAYIAFILLFLFIDIIRAVLSVPEKLDKIAKK